MVDDVLADEVVGRRVVPEIGAGASGVPFPGHLQRGRYVAEVVVEPAVEDLPLRLLQRDLTPQ